MKKNLSLLRIITRLIKMFRLRLSKVKERLKPTWKTQMDLIQLHPLSLNYLLYVQLKTVTPSQQRAQTKMKHKQRFPLQTKYLQPAHLSLRPHLLLRSPVWKRHMYSTSRLSGHDQHADSLSLKVCRPPTVVVDSLRALPSH